MKNNSIGIYGGSFNPFHKGHEYVIYNSKKELGLDKYYIIPSYENPLKNKISNFRVSSIYVAMHSSGALLACTVKSRAVACLG